MTCISQWLDTGCPVTCTPKRHLFQVLLELGCLHIDKWYQRLFILGLWLCPMLFKHYFRNTLLDIPHQQKNRRVPSAGKKILLQNFNFFFLQNLGVFTWGLNHIQKANWRGKKEIVFSKFIQPGSPLIIKRQVSQQSLCLTWNILQHSLLLNCCIILGVSHNLP